MKKDVILKEFARSLNEDDIRFVNSRISQRLAGDLSDVTEFLQSAPEMDYLLKETTTPNEFYDILDELNYFVEKEISIRTSDSISRNGKQ